MSEIVRNLDLLVMQALLVEEQLRSEILLLQKQRRRISALLSEKDLKPEQRKQLERLMEWQNARNLKMYGFD